MSDIAELGYRVDTRGLRDAEKRLDGMAKAGDKAKKSAKGTSRVMRELNKAVAGFGLFKLVQDTIGAASSMETMTAKLKTVTGSAAAASKALGPIKDFAKTTPFELNQAVDAFIKLKALGLDPSIESLRSYGNTAAAMGKDLNQMIEAVADAATGEFERLKEFGIKAKSQGEEVSFTFQGVTTTVGKNAAEIENYLRGIGDVNFATAMSDQMGTLSGVTSNLKDSFFNLQVEFMETSGVSDLLKSAITGMASAFEGATVWLAEHRSVIQSIIEILPALTAGFLSFMAVSSLPAILSGVAAGLTSIKTAALFLTGPAGIIAALVAGIVIFTTKAQAAKAAATEFAQGILDVGAAGTKAELLQLEKNIISLELKLGEAKHKLDEYNKSGFIHASMQQGLQAEVAELTRQLDLQREAQAKSVEAYRDALDPVDDLTGASDELGGAASDVATYTNQAAGGVINLGTASSTATPQVEGIADSLQTTIDNAKEAAGLTLDLGNTTGEQTGNMQRDWRNFATDSTDDILRFGTQVNLTWDDIFGGFKSLGDKLKSMAKNLVTSLINTFVNSGLNKIFSNLFGSGSGGINIGSGGGGGGLNLGSISNIAKTAMGLFSGGAAAGASAGAAAGAASVGIGAGAGATAGAAGAASTIGGALSAGAAKVVSGIKAAGSAVAQFAAAIPGWALLGVAAVAGLGGHRRRKNLKRGQLGAVQEAVDQGRTDVVDLGGGLEFFGGFNENTTFFRNQLSAEENDGVAKILKERFGFDDAGEVGDGFLRLEDHARKFSDHHQTIVSEVKAAIAEYRLGFTSLERTAVQSLGNTVVAMDRLFDQSANSGKTTADRIKEAYMGAFQVSEEEAERAITNIGISTDRLGEIFGSASNEVLEKLVGITAAAESQSQAVVLAYDRNLRGLSQAVEAQTAQFRSQIQGVSRASTDEAIQSMNRLTRKFQEVADNASVSRGNAQPLFGT